MKFTYTATATTTGFTITFTSGYTPGTYAFALNVNGALTTSAPTVASELTFSSNTQTFDFIDSLLWSSYTNPGDHIFFRLVFGSSDINTLVNAGTYASNISEDNSIIVEGAVGTPCFVESSKLLTPSGYVSAKDIKTGDVLVTADGRKVPVKAYKYTVYKTDKDTAPFLIKKNALGKGHPSADLRLSAWHAFQIKRGLWMKPMSLFELDPSSCEQYDIGKSVTYYHFEAPNYFKDNFVCEGTVVESYAAEQLVNFKGRIYKYNPDFKAYTRPLVTFPSKTGKV